MFRDFYHLYSNCSPFAFDTAPLKQAAFVQDPLCVQEPSAKAVTRAWGKIITGCLWFGVKAMVLSSLWWNAWQAAMWRKSLLWLIVWGYSSSWWGSQETSSCSQMMGAHGQLASSLVCNLEPSSIMVPLLLRVGLPVSVDLIKRIPHKRSRGSFHWAC